MKTLDPTPAAESAPAIKSTGLVQSLGLFSSTAIVAGSMIGSGIFLVDADIARGTNSPALFMGAWVVTAIMTMIGALSYGELAAMMPKAGGQYVYLRESLGPLWGFLYGWTLFLVIQTGTIAAVCVAFGKFLGVFFPTVSTTHWLWHIAHVPAIPIGPMVLGNMDIGVNTANLTAILHRDSAGHRQRVRRQAWRDDPKHLHFGQSSFAGCPDTAHLHSGPECNGMERQLWRRLERVLEERRMEFDCTLCRWALAGPWCW